MFLALIEEGIETYADIQGPAGLMAAKATHVLAAEMLNSITSAKAIHPDIEVDDVLIVKKTMPAGSTQKLAKLLRGTIKELVRGLKATVPVFKLLQADVKVRDYLLYCALSLVAAMD